MPIACLPIVLALAAGSTALGPSDAWLDALPTELDGAFVHVAQQVRFEPYPGVLRGARGTAIAGAGNAWDKALLLAELLRRGGYEVRLVEGELTAANREVLLRGAYPPRLPDPALGADFAPYSPGADPHLRAAVSTHVWLEVNQGERWLPLDPSFPRARPGEAYATRRRHFARPPREAFQRVVLSWKEHARATRELARVELVAAEVGLVPVLLSLGGVPLQASGAGAAKKSPGVVGLFGGGLGGAPQQPEPKPGAAPEPGTVGVQLQRFLQVGDRVQEVQSTVVQLAERDGRPNREWLELSLRVPGRSVQTYQRELYATGNEGLATRALLGQRRYALGIFNGPVPLAALDEQLQAARRLPLDDWQAEAKRLRADAEGVRRARQLERQLAAIPGHLLALSHAQASDALSDRLARASGVLVLREQPRVLIAALEAEGLDEEAPVQTVSLDLRVDEVHAVPWPGQAARAAQHFQRARGMMSSTIEGRVVAQATGREPATTSALMEKAREQGVPLVALARRSEVYRLGGLTRPGQQLILEALQRGRHVVVPEKKLLLAGRERTGFWELDPLSGAAVGVMDDGLRQAMVQYQLQVSRIGLDERSGKVFGLLMGSISVTGLLCAKILEHGEVNQQVLTEVKKYAQGILCHSCPKAEAKVSAQVTLGDDCWKYEKTPAEAYAKFDFCDAYADGFKCSMGILLAAYEGKHGYEWGGKVGASAEVACKQWPEGG
jgi:hypothetical protein